MNPVYYLVFVDGLITLSRGIYNIFEAGVMIPLSDIVAKTSESVSGKMYDILEVEFEKPLRVAVEHLAGERFSAYKMVDGRPIGTGPYVMTESGETLTMTPNPYYQGKETRVREVKMVVASAETMREKLQAGVIDAAIFAHKAFLPECSTDDSKKIGCAFGQEAEHAVVIVNGLPGRLFSNSKYRLALQALIQRKFDSGELPASLSGKHFMRDSQTFLKFQAGRLADAEAEGLIEDGRRYIPDLVKASHKSPVYFVSGRGYSWLQDLSRLQNTVLLLNL